jgi:hypothetical protein
LQEKLEAFVARIPDFASLSPARQLQFFAYFLTDVLREDGISGRRIQQCFDDLHIPAYSNIRAYVSTHTTRSPGKSPLFVRIKGKTYLHREFSATLASRLKGSHLVVAVKSDLRDLLPRIKDPNQKTFLAEALACFEVKAYRASIIMTWILAMDHLFQYILAHRLGAFNKILAVNTDKRIRISAIGTRDDFGEIPENKFIEFCRAAKIISNDVRKILDAKLGIRNTCAHPSAVTISESKAIDAIDDLVNNVILKYPI